MPQTTFAKWKPEQSLNQWHLMFFSIYGDKNSDRDQFKIFAHLAEVAGGFSKIVRKGENLADVISFLGKVFGWYSALAIKLGYRDLEGLVWSKYPYVCPYCGQSSCQCSPNTPPAVLPNTTLNRFQNENRHRRPTRLSKWQDMFLDIYGKKNRLLGSNLNDAVGTRPQLLVALNRLSEEMGELAEAIRLEHRYPIGVSSELADVFAWMMAVANVLPEHLEDDAFDLEDAIWSQYPGSCTYCYKRRCSCPNDRVRRSLIASAGADGEEKLDELTNLPRKDVFERDLNDAVVSATDQRPLNLIIVDLDHFKKVNDTFGHAFGDQVIRTAADVLDRVSSSSSGQAYRWGGEEFAVILPDYSKDEAYSFAVRMISELHSKPFSTPQGGDYRQTASAGVATLTGLAGEALAVVTRRLFDSADKALYDAKENGRNRVVAAQVAEGDNPAQ